MYVYLYYWDSLIQVEAQGLDQAQQQEQRRKVDKRLQVHINLSISEYHCIHPLPLTLE